MKIRTPNRYQLGARRARNLLQTKSHARAQWGFTLVELIVATAILAILTSLAIPLLRVNVKRDKERELRHALWEMRDAIDRYKDSADRGAFRTKAIPTATRQTWTHW